MSLFHRTEQTYRLLHQSFRELDIPIDEPLLLEGEHSATAAIKFVERHFFTRSPREYQDTESAGIRLIRPPVVGRR